MTPELHRLLERAKQLPPMTRAQLFEQRVSFVYGQLAFKNPDLTKERVRQNLIDAGYTP